MSVVFTVLFYLPVLLSGVAIMVAWRRPVWASPYCGKCRYDLRRGTDESRPRPARCPECGSDLAGERAVCFVNYRRRWWAVTLGTLVLVWPLASSAGLAIYFNYLRPSISSPNY